MSILLNYNRNYGQNKLPALNAWIGEGTTLTINGLLLSAGGHASASLSYTGLNSSAYKLLHIVFDGTLDASSNLTNQHALEVIFKYRYLQNTAANSNQQVSVYTYLHQTVAITPMNTTTQNGLQVCEKVLVFPELDAAEFEVTIKNRTLNAIEIYECTLKPSNDIQSAQLTDLIEVSAGLESVDAYTDGCLIKYRGDSEPVQIQYQEDSQGNFNGVLVNDTIFIPFTRHNEPL